MKILQIVDTPKWAIEQLSKAIRDYNPQISFQVLYVGPRDINEKLDEVRKVLKEFNPDLVDFQYWNVAWQLVEKIPEFLNYKKCLTHHNQKNLLSADWSQFDVLFCKTQKSLDILNKEYPGKIVKIPNMININHFEYNDNPPVEKSIGYVGRVVPWKGLKEIAKAAYELKVPLYLMGVQDRPQYWAEIPQEHKDNMKFDYFDCDDKDKTDFFRSIMVYAGFSGNNHEEGTLGFLEAMASGVPIVTTTAGMANDLGKDGENMLLVDFDDYDGLKHQLKRMLDDDELRNQCRQNAWQVIKKFTHERMAFEYQKIYDKIVFKEPLVSVIIPAIFKHKEQIKQILDALKNNLYTNIEVILCWDELSIEDNISVFNISDYDFGIIEVVTEKEGYNLAMARNLGVIASHGQILVFCDSRLAPEHEAISYFVKAVLNTRDKIWVFGDKGAGKRNFVENFSAIRREYLIKGGMFNERITEYGGMSQELRSRFQWQGFELKYMSEAMARELRTSKMTSERRKNITSMKGLLYKLGL